MNDEIRNLTLKFCKDILNHYSKSYKWSFKFLNYETKNSLYIIYAYLRIIDEIIDSPEIENKEFLLNNLYKTTFETLKPLSSENLIVDLVKIIIMKYNLNKEYFDSFYKCMYMDLHEKELTKDNLNIYINGTGISIGKICLQIACKNNNELYYNNESAISNISSAFQKINLIRDSRHDKQILNRNYLAFISNKVEFVDFVKGIKSELKKGLKGVFKLPKGVRLSISLGILVNYIYIIIINIKFKMNNKYYI